MVLVLLGGGVRNAHASTLAVDGAVESECGSAGSCPVTLTTGGGNEVIIVFASNSASADSFMTLSDTASLSFTSRTTTNAEGVIGEEWYAIASAMLTSDTITLTTSATNHHFFSLAAWGISGADTANPFDPNGALPAKNSGGTGVTPQVVVSTSNPNDMLLGLVGGDGTRVSYGAGSGFTLIDSPGGTSGVSEFQVVTGTQSGVSVGLGINPVFPWVMVGDAVQAAPAPPPIPEYPFGLPLLAIFTVIAFGLIRRRTKN